MSALSLKSTFHDKRRRAMPGRLCTISGSRTRTLYGLLLFAGLVAGCSRGVRFKAPEADTRSRILHVGILQNRPSVKFRVSKGTTLLGADGRGLGRLSHEASWTVQPVNESPLDAVYYLRYFTTPDAEAARAKAYDLSSRNFPWEVVETGAMSANGSRALPGNGYFHVVLKQVFRDKHLAERIRARVADSIRFELLEISSAPPTTQLQFTAAGVERAFTAPSGARIAGHEVTLLDVPIGSGFHFSDAEDEIFRGEIEFRLLADGTITVINLLPFESYLRGVVPSEMHPDFPAEALKAQAIASRGQILSKLGRHEAEGFDICATVHCQVYRGIALENDATTEAVKATEGLLLFSEGKPLDTVYAGVCGGQTENNENIWNGAPVAALRGVFDGKGAADLLDETLRDEAKVAAWIKSQPPVYCNIAGQDAPPFLAYARKYFRWQVRESRLNLERYIQQATGQSPGTLLDIVPRRRGISGRLTRVAAIGTDRTVELQSELEIRRAFSASALFSSCFIIEKRLGQDGLPAAFIFTGAGWGHGVGMCQTGAAMMALDGASFEQILKKYYAGAVLGSAD